MLSMDIYLNALRYQETFFEFEYFCQPWQFSHWSSFPAFLWNSCWYHPLSERSRFWRRLKIVLFVHLFLCWFEIWFPKFVPSSKIQLTRHLARRTIKSSYRYRLMMFKVRSEQSGSYRLIAGFLITTGPRTIERPNNSSLGLNWVFENYKFKKLQDDLSR